MVLVLGHVFDFPVEKADRQRARSAWNINSRITNLIDAFKGLKLDESPKEVSGKIRRSPGALQH